MVEHSVVGSDAGSNCHFKAASHHVLDTLLEKSKLRSTLGGSVRRVVMRREGAEVAEARRRTASVPLVLFIPGVKFLTALVDPHNEYATLTGGRIRRGRRECRPGPLSCSSDVVPPINKDKDKDKARNLHQKVA